MTSIQPNSPAVRLSPLASLNAALFSGSQILFVPLFPWLAERMQVPLAQVLLCFSAGSLLFLWGSPYWARTSDAKGRLPVLRLGSLGLAGAFALTACLGLGLLHGWAALALLLTARLLYGLLASAIAPVAQAQQADLQPHARQGVAMARHSLSLSAGRVAALVAALALPPLALLACATLLTLALAALNWWHRYEAAAPAVDAAAPSFSGAPPQLWPVFTLAFCFTSSVELLNASLAAELRRLFSLGPAEVSPLVAKLLLAASVLVLLSQWAARRALHRGWRAPLLSGLTALGLGMLLFSVAASQTQLWLAIALISVALGLVPPSYLTALSRIGGQRRGRAAGLLAAMQTLGYAAGGALAALSLHVSAAGPAPFLLAVTGISCLLGVLLCARRASATA